MLHKFLLVAVILCFASLARAQVVLPGCDFHAPTNACEDEDRLGGVDAENLRLFVNALYSRANALEVCTPTQVLGGAVGGGVECQADDDVPEVGDFGDATSLDANGAINIPYVATVTGDVNIGVTGAGTVGRPVQLSLLSPVTLDADAHPRVVTSSLDDRIPRFNGTTGDLESATNAPSYDAPGNLTVVGTATFGGQTLGILTLSTNPTTPGPTSGTRGDMRLETDATTNNFCINTSATTGTTWLCGDFN